MLTLLLVLEFVITEKSLTECLTSFCRRGKVSMFTYMLFSALWFPQSGKLGKYFQESWRLQKVLDKILKILETKIRLIQTGDFLLPENISELQPKLCSLVI